MIVRQESAAALSDGVTTTFTYGTTGTLSQVRGGTNLNYDPWGRAMSLHNRPQNGNYVGEAYAECPVCKRDFWLNVCVEHDVITSYEVDADRPGYAGPGGATD